VPRDVDACLLVEMKMVAGFLEAQSVVLGTHTGMIEDLAARVLKKTFVALSLCSTQVLETSELHCHRVSKEGDLSFCAEHRHSCPGIAVLAVTELKQWGMTYLLASLDTTMTWSSVVTSKVLLLTINTS
jgi:hypothetical protein